jgi:hypothetical protein
MLHRYTICALMNPYISCVHLIYTNMYRKQSSMLPFMFCNLVQIGYAAIYVIVFMTWCKCARHLNMLVICIYLGTKFVKMNVI